MPNKSDTEVERFLIIVSKNLRKHGLKKMINSIQSIEFQENSPHYDMIMKYIFEVVSDEFCVTKDNLLNKDMRGVVTVARKIAMLIAKENLGVSDEKLAYEFNRVRQTVYAAVKEFELLDRDNKIDKRFFEKYDSLNEKVVKYIKMLKGEGIE